MTRTTDTKKPASTTDADQPERLDLRSHDIAADKMEELLRLFPEIRTEGGKIDFDRLRLALGETVDVGKERFGLTWPGKADCFKTIQAPSMATLRPAPDESVNWDATENMIIEGDNLEVLKLLQKSYLGKIKMIYIDPPYNTGNDFIYPDDYSENLQTYLEYTGQVDAEGRKFGTNTDTDGRFHSKWLNMMYPRLYLARNLLRDDGCVLISIDDTELCNLRRVCDDVFGEGNFIAQIIWKKRSTPPNDKVVGAQHDYIVVYSKSADSAGLLLRERSEQQCARYKNPDGHPKGDWASSDLTANVKGGRYVESLYFPVTNPNTTEEHYPSNHGNWRFNRERIADLLANNEIYFGADGRGKPMLKRFLCDVKEGITWTTLWDFAPFNTVGSQEMNALLGDAATFENPKPSGLIEQVLRVGLDTGELVLDFFAGSGTTAHAVLNLNKQDGGNRKFVLVQLPEPVDPESVAGRAGFKTIADITKERVRRVSKKLNDEDNGKLELNADQSKQDRGFRVYKLDESNFEPWEADKPEDATTLGEQMEMHIEHIRDERTDDDILYEILLKSGFPLTTPVETVTLADKKVYSVAEGALLICLERELTLEAIRAMAKMKPERVVCLDAGFAGNDQLKANAVQDFRNKGVTSFRTV